MCFNSGCKIYFSEHSFQKLILKTLFRAIFENSIVPSSVHHFCVSNWFLRLFFSSELSFTHSFSYNLTAISRGNHFWGLGLRGLKPPQEQDYQKSIPKVPIRTFSLQIFKSPLPYWEANGAPAGYFTPFGDCCHPICVSQPIYGQLWTKRPEERVSAVFKVSGTHSEHIWAAM